MVTKTRPIPIGVRRRGWRAPAWLGAHLRSRQQMVPLPAPATRIPALLWFGAVLFFFGIYTNIGVKFAEVSTIPMVSALPGLALLLCYPGLVSPRMVRFVVVPMLFVLAFSVLAPQFGRLLFKRVAGVGQTGFSALIGYVVAWTLARFGRVRLHKFLAIAIPVFLILIVVELALPPMRALMIAYHDLYGLDLDLDVLADRENTMGGYRPKLFTSETSYVATSAMLLLIGYVWTGAGVRRYVFAAGYMVVAVALIRSPIVALALPPIFAAVYTDPSLGRNRGLYAFWVTIITVMVVSAVALLGFEVIANRLSSALSGQDYSTTYRTYGALVVAFNVLKAHPLFGAGAGTLLPVKDIVISTYLDLGVPLDAAETSWLYSINNAFASVLIYFGLVGTTVLLVFLWRLFKSDVNRPVLPVLLAFLCYNMTYGGIYTPTYFATVAAIFTVAKLRVITPPRPTASRRPPFRISA